MTKKNTHIPHVFSCITFLAFVFCVFALVGCKVAEEESLDGSGAAAADVGATPDSGDRTPGTDAGEQAQDTALGDMSGDGLEDTSDTSPEEVQPSEDLESTGPFVLPDSPVGVQAKWALDVLNGQVPVDEAEILQRLSPETLEKYPASSWLSWFAYWTKERPYTMLGTDGLVNETEMRIRMRDGKDYYQRLNIVLSDTNEGMIDTLYLNPAPELDPVFGGPIGVDEVGVTVRNPFYSYNAVKDVDVELVDATTGESLDPPVVVKTDSRYGYFRAPMPEGKTSLGFRVQLADGSETTTYFRVLRAGRDLNSIYVYTKNTLTHYPDLVDVEGDVEKAQIRGTIGYELFDDLGTEHFWKEVPEGESWGVGCATVEFEPAGPAPVYSDPVEYMPSLDITETSRTTSWWWAFNVDPVPYTVTARISVEGSDEAKEFSMNIPAPKAGGFTVVYMMARKDEFPGNPTAPDCPE